MPFPHSRGRVLNERKLKATKEIKYGKYDPPKKNRKGSVVVHIKCFRSFCWGGGNEKKIED